MSISKELLSEVLDEPFDRLVSQNNRLINIETVNGAMVDGQYLDIYYVAHKCKEWAYSQMLFLQSGRTSSNKYKAYFRGDLSETWYANTEPEAIFKCAEWILKEKKC